jgi:hypothetical protein
LVLACSREEEYVREALPAKITAISYLAFRSLFIAQGNELRHTQSYPLGNLIVVEVKQNQLATHA